MHAFIGYGAAQRIHTLTGLLHEHRLYFILFHPTGFLVVSHHLRNDGSWLTI